MPSWSPDRRKIVYVSARSGDAEIYVMNADGTGQRRLAGSKKGPQDQYPAWSPDGKLIAFASNRNGEADIYVMRSDGTGLRELTKNAVWLEDTQPRFSPGGSSSSRRTGSPSRTPSSTECESRTAAASCGSHAGAQGATSPPATT
ncbi:MAG: PD40 domain-containing protein [Actinobacteria bacterium]|nr:PD40 domain-containing protein [Actinomycetota bacterium]